MATTSIWAVKGWLGKVVLYIENPPLCLPQCGQLPGKQPPSPRR